MRIDLYRRPEADNQFSYLAVPEGKRIPEEATSTDWVVASEGVEMGDEAVALRDYGMPTPARQIAEKGYAITSVTQPQS
jgi:hypothetical protein